VQPPSTLTLCPCLPQAAKAAASAFRSLCLRCCLRLRNVATVSALVEAAQPVLQTPAGGGLPVPEAKAVVEGLARLVASLPGATRPEAAARLALPFILRAHQACSEVAATSGTLPASKAHAVSAGLQLLACTLRYIVPTDQDGASASPDGITVSRALLDEARGVLESVASNALWHTISDVPEAAVEVYRQALGSDGGTAGAAHLPGVLHAVRLLLRSPALPSCLRLLAEQVEAQCDEPDALQLLVGMMDEAAAVSFELLQASAWVRLTRSRAAATRSRKRVHSSAITCATQPPSPPWRRLDAGSGHPMPGHVPCSMQGRLQEHHELAASLLNLASQFALHAPAELARSHAAPRFIELAASATRLREADGVAAALALLNHLLELQDANQPARSGEPVVGARIGAAPLAAAPTCALLQAGCNSRSPPFPCRHTLQLCMRF
jgi:hypothetical protein